MGTEKKKGGCLSIFIKWFLAICVIGGLASTDSSEKDHEEALTEVTAFMDAREYQDAINRLDEYWEKYSLSDDKELAELYAQCFEAQGQYVEAADVIVAVFQEQGYEDELDGLLHTRLTSITAMLSEAELDTIQKALEEIPDSLEEKNAIEKERKATEEAAKEAKEKAEEKAEDEKGLRELLLDALSADTYDWDTRDRIKKICGNYLDRCSEFDYADTVTQIAAQIDVIDKSNRILIDYDTLVKVEYPKVLNNFYGDYYIDYKLEPTKGLSTVIATIQDALGEHGNYNDWVAGDLEYFYGTEVPGDTVYIIRTQRMFPESGGYFFHLIPDGTIRLNRSGGFELTAEVYREVSDEYIAEVYEKYDEYCAAETNREQAYQKLEQLAKALEDK